MINRPRDTDCVVTAAGRGGQRVSYIVLVDIVVSDESMYATGIHSKLEIVRHFICAHRAHNAFPS